MSSAEEIAALLTEHEIVPQIIPNAPQKKLVVNYGVMEATFGNKFPPNELKFAPKITLPEADTEQLYSLLMIDPDNLSRAKPTVAEWLHWMQLNMPGSNLKDGLMGGQCVMAYGSPGPGPRTGPHRYVLFLWEHGDTRVAFNKPEGRGKFKTKAFMEKTKLGDPLAVNFFFSEAR